MMVSTFELITTLGEVPYGASTILLESHQSRADGNRALARGFLLSTKLTKLFKYSILPQAMQAVILCGGKGTRLNEYTEALPKPLVQIVNKPILHHLMDLYASFGHKDFILLIGYKGDKIKEYFKDNKEFNIQFIDSGEEANKAQRLLDAKKLIKEDTFLMSYGDDLTDADINNVIEFHKKNKKVVTLTAVPLLSPFGIIEVNENDEVTSFREKPKLNHWMNGGF